MSWVYNGLPFENMIDAEYYGFVYLITNLKTGKMYVGKKLFWSKKTRQVKGKKKKELVESDWRDYWGSNQELLSDIEKFGKEHFTRTILRLCKTKGEATYYESKEIFERDALLKEEYYNSWVMCRVRKSHLQCQNPKKIKSTGTQKP